MIYGEKMGKPTAQRTRLSRRLKYWIFSDIRELSTDWSRNPTLLEHSTIYHLQKALIVPTALTLPSKVVEINQGDCVSTIQHRKAINIFQIQVGIHNIAGIVRGSAIRPLCPSI